MTSAAGRRAHIHSSVTEGRYEARLLAGDDTEMEACWRLRHRVFVQQRAWVPDNPAWPGLEVDAYDPHAWHLAAFDGQEIAAYLRALPWRPGIGFMLEREFSGLLAPSACAALPRAGAVELSRLACSGTGMGQSGFGRAGDLHPLEVLLKLLYRLALAEKIEHFHIVVEASWLRPFTRRFALPFSPLGEARTLAGGTRTVAATAKLCDLRGAMLLRRPDKHLWYRDGEEAPTQMIELP